ncbi:UDP-glucose--hexose-1-phosphate uridylyltransferase [Ovoidimarina sediminis]|uniref:UDP-glucose--hexose-1-phosphate uridylyltransferase n=1 Tax=Ovoidimarina sediminis TaxID=3079856 RepID=UPI0029079683|nr:UDP-glucose--hexose-1-phosphate uridylyltransferase [Rhodophyticola sp. MJ-SS7]MDU8944158.1 UDP-glucose--hexose-1-phosphate uridylyltransferase [Rhodophyticola sp. MJ-SS7]
MNFEEHPHRRFDPLRGDWVLVSPHRSRRPWQGQSETPVTEPRPRHDPACYLCAGNQRANGAVNPDYSGPLVFENDFPALLKDTAPAEDARSPLFRSQSACGTSRVICFSERHDQTLPALPVQEIRKVVDVWIREYEDLARTYAWVAIFENKGAMMGSSNPHPHGQIWASDFIPSEVAREDRTQRAFLTEAGTNMLVTYGQEECAQQIRIVLENRDWIAVVPYWAVWPFETLLLPRRHCPRLSDLDTGERDTLADILKRLCKRYDALFDTEFPYSMGWHGAPPAQDDTAHWQLHAHFYPPLLRSATVRKFLVGYELLAEPQRDLTAEQAAARIRALPDQNAEDSEA